MKDLSFQRILTLINLALLVAIPFVPNIIYHDGSCLPPIHDTGGSREVHDDWLLGSFINRKYTSFCNFKAPVIFFGNQRYWSAFNRELHTKIWQYSELGDLPTQVGEYKLDWGPKPIPRPGEWQFSVVTVDYPRLPTLGLPYLAFTTKYGVSFRIGARWTDGYPSYVQYPSIAIKGAKGLVSHMLDWGLL